MAVTYRTLPCGRDPVDVWDGADEGRQDGHEQTCPYCQEVLHQHRAMAAPLARWSEAAAAAPPALLEQVLASVRATLRSRHHVALPSAAGPVNLDLGAAEAALRWSSDQLLGARVRHCTITVVDRDELGEDAEPRLPLVRVELSLVAPDTADLRDLADRARSIVATVATDVLSLDVAGIDVHVADLYQGP